MGGFVAFVVIVGLAVWFLKGFDKLAGRSPKQVRDGINQSRSDHVEAEERIPCPQCAERILPAAKICPFCRSPVQSP